MCKATAPTALTEGGRLAMLLQKKAVPRTEEGLRAVSQKRLIAKGTRSEPIVRPISIAFMTPREAAPRKVSLTDTSKTKNESERRK
mmetsp:Transcript_13340/g.27449  ORF Transcript_13340/g.27449 Transcript_13340/m.27449 type:complete len:86 (-) Transcript_13340:80-337(-)